MKKLTAKQQKFVAEYLVDLNGTKAAIRAGYSEKTARSIAAENLTKPNIAAAVKEEMDKRAERTEITQDRVLKELALLGFSNMQDYMTVDYKGSPVLDFSDLTRDQAAALVEVTTDTRREAGSDGDDLALVEKVKFKLADKRAALVDIGKHLGMFKDTLDINANIGVTRTLADFYNKKS